jgi:hypothetical protein
LQAVAIHALELVAHADHFVREVDVFPGQAKRFAMPKAEAEEQKPQRVEPVIDDDRQQRGEFVVRQRGGSLHWRRLAHQRVSMDVQSSPTSALRSLEAVPQRSTATGPTLSDSDWRSPR